MKVAGRLTPSKAVYFYPAQMRQVLINLLRNAVEASEGRPDIQVRIQDSEDGWDLCAGLGPGQGYG